MIKAVALVSPARRSQTGRPQRAQLDARAVELGLQLGAQVMVLCAGSHPPAELNLYRGMGVEVLQFLTLEPSTEIVTALVDGIRSLSPNLVLAGAISQADAATGLVPYQVADQLGWPLLAEASALRLSENRVIAEQRLGRGFIRSPSEQLPCVITVGQTGPIPRDPAFGLVQRAEISVRHSSLPNIGWEGPTRLRDSARPRPALDTLIQLDSSKSISTSQRSSDGTPDEIADHILQILKAKGLLFLKEDQ